MKVKLDFNLKHYMLEFILNIRTSFRYQLFMLYLGLLKVLIECSIKFMILNKRTFRQNEV